MSSNKSENNNCLLYCCGSICGIIAIVIVYGWPVSEIVIGAYYRNEITCQSTLPVTISDWLIVKGTVSIVTITILGFCLITSNTSLCNCLSMTFMYVCNLFMMIWLIIGSIVFWRDCINLHPNTVNIYMWISLIFGYFSVLSSTSLSSINNTEKNNKKPLLDIA